MGAGLHSAISSTRHPSLVLNPRAGNVGVSGPTPIPTALLGPTPQGIRAGGRLDCEEVGSPSPHPRRPDTRAASSVPLLRVLAAFRDRHFTGRAQDRVTSARARNTVPRAGFSQAWAEGGGYSRQGSERACLKFQSTGCCAQCGPWKEGKSQAGRPGRWCCGSGEAGGCGSG